MARARAVFIRSPWEKPSVRRSAIDPQSQGREYFVYPLLQRLRAIPRSLPKYIRLSRTLSRE
jgi:hypothetical protein